MSTELGIEQNEHARTASRTRRFNKILTRVVVATIIAVICATVFVLWSVWQDSQTIKSPAERELVLMRVAVEQWPDSPQARVDYAVALYGTGEIRDALRELEIARSLESSYTPAIYNTALIYWDQGDEEEAVEELLQVLLVAPRDTTARYKLATFYTSMDRVDEAANEYEILLGVDPTDSAAHVALGRILAQQGDEASARTHFEEALRFVPDYGPALEALESID